MNVPYGWVYNDRDIEHTPRDASRDLIYDLDAYLLTPTAILEPVIEMDSSDDGLVPTSVQRGDHYPLEEPG